MNTKRYVSVVAGVARRNIRVNLRNPAMLVPPIISPIMFLVVFACGLSALTRSPGFVFNGNYTAFQLVFAMVQGVLFAGITMGISMAHDFESGIARRMMLGATHRSAVLVGYVVSNLLRSAVIVMLVVAVGLAAGADVHGSVIDVLGLGVLALLVGTAASLWTAGVALRLRSTQAGPLMQMPTIVVLFLAPAFVPLVLLTGWFHAVALGNPMTAVFEGGRGLISGGHDTSAAAFAASAALVLAFSLWALRGLRSAERSG